MYRSDWQPLGRDAVHKRGQGMSPFEISLNGVNGQVEASKGKVVECEEPALADADRSAGVVDAGGLAAGQRRRVARGRFG